MENVPKSLVRKREKKTHRQQTKTTFPKLGASFKGEREGRGISAKS